MGSSNDATSVVNDAIDNAFSGTNFFDTLMEDETYGQLPRRLRKCVLHGIYRESDPVRDSPAGVRRGDALCSPLPQKAEKTVGKLPGDPRSGPVSIFQRQTAVPPVNFQGYRCLIPTGKKAGHPLGAGRRTFQRTAPAPASLFRMAPAAHRFALFKTAGSCPLRSSGSHTAPASR